MRINRFCEARGLYESDNSIESKIFCFGDDGPSGDTSSTAASEDIGTKDVDKGPTFGPNQRDDSGDRQAYSDQFGGTSTRNFNICLLYTSPSPRDGLLSRMPSSA